MVFIGFKTIKASEIPNNLVMVTEIKPSERAINCFQRATIGTVSISRREPLKIGVAGLRLKLV